jgi:hypothetical protein
MPDLSVTVIRYNLLNVTVTRELLRNQTRFFAILFFYVHLPIQAVKSKYYVNRMKLSNEETSPSAVPVGHLEYRVSVNSSRDARTGRAVRIWYCLKGLTSISSRSDTERK